VLALGVLAALTGSPGLVFLGEHQGEQVAVGFAEDGHGAVVGDRPVHALGWELAEQVAVGRGT